MVFCDNKMIINGLPLYGEKYETDRGVLAGADFLSVFLRLALRDTTTAITTTTITPESITTAFQRETRSAEPLTVTKTFYENSNLQEIDEQSSDNSEGVVVVRVSSSIGRTLNNNSNNISNKQIIENTTTKEIIQITTLPTESIIVSSKQHPSLIAEINKSKFNVEESEPITTNDELIINSDYSDRGYPASVQPLASSQFHQTLIFHNDKPDKSHSVSYSTVIQSVPSSSSSSPSPSSSSSLSSSAAAAAAAAVEKEWENKHERHERHYDGSAFSNSFNDDDDNNNNKINETNMDETTRKLISSITTEKNWELNERHYILPTRIYGQPEQNYEVDESASVMTNGRIHGIQPSLPTLSTSSKDIKNNKKADDHQKVGYVVEGRNYRKYRVEERTSDGFIVGEYGVVSHDDGSLRGVRYTADGTINPRLIYDALMKFLSL